MADSSAKSKPRVFISILALILVICQISYTDGAVNQGCLGVPKDKAEGIRCFLESDNPQTTSQSSRVDCSLNFHPGNKVRFQCEKLYKPVGLATEDGEEHDDDEKNDENFWEFSKCLGGNEWDKLNSTVSLTDFRCELDSGLYDTGGKSALISGGVEIAPTSMPWMAAIFQGETYICGGTLIAKSFVLTAAHCIALEESVGIGSLPPEQFTVVLGSSSGIFSEATDLKTNAKAQIFKVIQVSMHANYSGAPSHFNDIAILQLENEVKPTKFVATAKLPSKSQIRAIEKGGFVLQVNGFGVFSNESAAASDKLLATNVTTRHFEECEQYERTFDHERQFCGMPSSGDQSVSGICKGDSGSGAYIKDGKIGQERWSIQGLVSFGTSKSRLFQSCYNVTFFTKVESYKSWIDQEKARLAQQFRYGQDLEKPPKVELSYEGGPVDLIDGTFTISNPLRDYLTVASTVFITCSAPYPIKFVYKDRPFEPINQVILQEDDNFVSYKDFYETSAYIFKIRAKFGFHEFARNINFSCESSSEGLNKRQFIEFSDEDYDEEEQEYGALTYKIRPRGKGQGQGHREMRKDSTVQVSSDPCKAFFYYEEVDEDVLGFPTYRFHCQRADGSPGKLKQISCATRAKCQNYFGTISQPPKNCWREMNNGTSIKKDGAVTDFNFIPFIPICLPVKEYGENPENEVSLPVFYSLPGGFNSRPDIFFEGVDKEKPELFRKFSELSRIGQQSMIQMKEFGHVHLLNSVVQVVCHTSHYWTARSFQFAIQLANETDLRLLPVDQNTDYDPTLNANIQVAHVTLNDPRIERVWCFGGIENTRDWLNSSRPVRILEKEWELIQANRQCNAVATPSKGQETPGTGQRSKKALEKPPELQIVFMQKGAARFKDVKEGAPQLTVPRFPRFGTDIFIKCKASYSIQMVQHIHDEQGYQIEESVTIDEFFSATNNTDRNFEVKGYFFHGTSGQHRIIRCESRDNSSVQASLEYSYDKLRKTLHVSAVEEERTKLKVPPEICARDKNQVGSGRECEAIFYYESRKDFPFFGFRCEFPFGRVGEVKVHPCSSPAHCLNLYKDRRQSSKCWKKSEGCSPTLKQCPGITKTPSCQGKNCSTLIVPSSHRPFVATCSRGTPGQPGYEETVWGSFAHFSGIPMDDSGDGSRAKLHFGDLNDPQEEEEEHSLLYMEPFPQEQTLGNTISVTCRVSKFYAYDLIQVAVDVRRRKKLKVLEVKETHYSGLAYHSWAPDDGRRFWKYTAEIKLDSKKIERIYCFGRSLRGSQPWFNVSRPVTFATKSR